MKIDRHNLSEETLGKLLDEIRDRWFDLRFKGLKDEGFGLITCQRDDPCAKVSSPFVPYGEQISHSVSSRPKPPQRISPDLGELSKSEVVMDSQ